MRAEILFPLFGFLFTSIRMISYVKNSFRDFQIYFIHLVSPN